MSFRMVAFIIKYEVSREMAPTAQFENPGYMGHAKVAPVCYGHALRTNANADAITATWTPGNWRRQKAVTH